MKGALLTGRELSVFTLAPMLEAKIEKKRSIPIQSSLGYCGIFTDQTTDTRYEIYGAACGSPSCLCDAVVYPLDHSKSALTRAAKLRLTEIEARQVELYTDLGELPSADRMRRREIRAELERLASEDHRIRGAAA